MPEQIAITHTAREVRASSSRLSGAGGVAMGGLLAGPRGSARRQCPSVLREPLRALARRGGRRDRGGQRNAAGGTQRAQAHREDLAHLGHPALVEQLASDQRRAWPSVRVVHEVLLRLEGGLIWREGRFHQVEVARDDVDLVGVLRLVIQRVVRGIEHPRPPEGASTDHHGHAARLVHHPAGIGERPHVAVASDGDVHRTNDVADHVPRRAPGVELRARPRMHRDRVDADVLRHARDLHGVLVLVAPASPDLDRERGVGDRATDRRQQSCR